MKRFLKAQDNGVYEIALKEIKNGEKESHWMWFIFPQIEGLGFSYKAKKYALNNLQEVLEYIDNEILFDRLVEISKEVFKNPTTDIEDIFYYPDNLKFQSCMSLFAVICPQEAIFKENIDKYFNGQMCEYTVNKCKEWCS